MKFETVLDAMLLASAYMGPGMLGRKHIRQYGKFRDWLIRHDERQKMRIAKLEAVIQESWRHSEGGE